MGKTQYDGASHHRETVSRRVRVRPYSRTRTSRAHTHARTCGHLTNASQRRGDAPRRGAVDVVAGRCRERLPGAPLNAAPSRHPPPSTGLRRDGAAAQRGRAGAGRPRARRLRRLRRVLRRLPLLAAERLPRKRRASARRMAVRAARATRGGEAAKCGKKCCDEQARAHLHSVDDAPHRVRR